MRGSNEQRRNQEAKRAMRAMRKAEARKRLSPERRAALTTHIEAVTTGKTPPMNTGKAARRAAEMTRLQARAPRPQVAE
jgi:hypothetical protein